ncbi:hypothetical protein E2C01_014127 [Portunus trituberculatus]|uniref:Uncharacterized protein n=1 Tax=Portunus trituberculatus TaxID=210409 RepID=A0A5B7DHZ8_PORTR|nr:hypothetical protein [Portunus trituberculatus]
MEQEAEGLDHHQHPHQVVNLEHWISAGKGKGCWVTHLLLPHQFPVPSAPTRAHLSSSADSSLTPTLYTQLISPPLSQGNHFTPVCSSRYLSLNLASSSTFCISQSFAVSLNTCSWAMSSLQLRYTLL